jgi:hypothetical protein
MLRANRLFRAGIAPSAGRDWLSPTLQTVLEGFMNSAIILMTILGCGDSATACEYVRTVEAQYQSVGECRLQVETELRKTGSANYPTVIALCEAQIETASQAPQPTGPEIIAEPTVILSEFDRPAGKGPIRKVVERTGNAISGMGRAIGSTWNRITGHDRRSADPIRLGRYMAVDS